MKKSIFESYFSQYESKITIQTITYGRLNSVIYDVEYLYSYEYIRIGTDIFIDISIHIHINMP
jgi:hypothetical protein